MEEGDRTVHLQLSPRHWQPPSGTILPTREQKGKKLFSLSFTRPITGPQLLQDWHHTPHTHTSLPSLLLHSHTLTHTLSNWSTPHFLLPFGRAFFSFLFFFFFPTLPSLTFWAEWIYFYPVVDHGAWVEGCIRDPPNKDRGEPVPFGDIAAVLWFLEGSRANRWWEDCLLLGNRYS